MASQKYKWPTDPPGKPASHSISWSQHQANTQQGSAYGKGQPAPVPPPPPGTYDPAIDYNASGSQRGYTQFANDAQTQFEQGGEDYQTGLAGILRGETRLGEDYQARTADLGRNYGILGTQQAERFGALGDASQGLLAASKGIRGANQGREQGVLTQMRDRGLEDFGQQRTLLDRGFNRVFAGYQPGMKLGPDSTLPTGAGSLLTSLWRGYGENDAFQNFSAGQRASQAAANRWVPPGPPPLSAAHKKDARAFGPLGRGSWTRPRSY